MPTLSSQLSLTQIQRAFLTALPRIEAHGNVYFRNVKCTSMKAEYLAEMTALSWKWFQSLVRRGKDPSSFVSAIASFAARAVKSGRRLCGQEKAKDVLSPRAQQRRGFAVGRLPDFSSLNWNPLSEALADNTRTPPDEAAAFRIDFPEWLASLDDRKKRITEELMLGKRTLDVASRHGISPARISQMRREFEQDWLCFLGEAASSPTTATSAAV